jgi:hypothetical protein
VAHPLGLLILLAALRWRRPEARLVMLLGCAPQSMALYEAAPLGLVVRTRGEGIFLVGGSVVAKMALHSPDSYSTLDAAFRAGAPIFVACLYLPAVAIVLSRPNVGEVPAWVDRFMAPLPVWIRGISRTTEGLSDAPTRTGGLWRSRRG